MSPSLRRSTTAALLAGALSVPSLLGTGAVVAQPADGPTACGDGFALVARSAAIVPEDVHRLSSSVALIAGGAPLPWGRRAPRISRYGPGTWQVSSTTRGANDAGYVAIGGSRSTGLWAVGYRRDASRLRPLMARRGASGAWRRVRLPAVPSAGATLSDVAAAGPRSAWAVGYRLSRPGQRKPLTMRWDGRRWTVSNPGMGRATEAMLASVSSTDTGGTWAAGSFVRRGLERPLIVRRANGTWQQADLPDVGRGALSAITVASGDDGWAVGYRFAADGLVPLILRWDGDTWQVHESPEAGDGDTVLLDVWADAAGAVIAAGSTWSSSARRMQGLLLRWDGDSWSSHVLPGDRTHLAFTGVDGDPSAGGWVTGRGLKTGLLARTCDPTTHEPAPSAATPDASLEAPPDTSLDAVADAMVTEETLDTTSASPAVTAPTDVTGRAQTPPERGPLGAGAVSIQDQAAATGLPTSSLTWGGVVEDFDGDGRDDIFISRHGGRAQLYLDRGDSFQASDLHFGGGDRHGCAAADFDASGLPDLYCSFGGSRGLGVKANQLWLDPGGPTARLDPHAGGIPEPLGRGRRVAVLDADVDGYQDLFVGQEPNRMDGLPVLNRLYLGDDTARFRRVRGSEVAAGIGTAAVDVADFDGDGRDDLLLAYEDDLAASPTRGIKLYRNTPDGLRDVSRALGVRSIGETDAELVRLDGDDRPDLVQVSGDRVRISLQLDDRFEAVYERAISRATAVAAGDADGDGDQDLYVLRDKRNNDLRDLILFNGGDGRKFRVVRAPSRSGGRADDVLAIDHDQNGLTDFLVLNGRGDRGGPIQLISFFREHPDQR